MDNRFKFTMGDAWGIVIGLLLGTFVLAGVMPIIHGVAVSRHPWETLGSELFQIALWVIIPLMILVVMFMVGLMMRGSRHKR